MKRNFGHEDAGLATPESLDTIVKNFNISKFLETNEKRYLVGPKGSGKTLLLLRKAIDQRKLGDGICIPSDPDLPVDRLTAAQHVGRKFNYSVDETRESSLAWATVWKHSIYRSVLHHLHDQNLAGVEPDSPPQTGDRWIAKHEVTHPKSQRKLVTDLVNDKSSFPRRPYYYYTDIGAKLDSSPRSALQTVRKENEELDAVLRDIRRPVYIFLDNLDDYYEREPNLWFNSMYGQFRAVREISLSHRNIHVFSSLRRDVYEQFSDEMRLQYFDYVALLDYRKDELLDIFEAHIKDLDRDLLMEQKGQASDPWRAFFGDCCLMPNEFIGVKEDIRDYLHRHTFGRPRDMIHMGTVLLSKRPRRGFDADSIREAIVTAEEDIAEQYLAEIRPLLDQRFNIKEFIKNHVPSNIISRDQVKQSEKVFADGQDDLYDRDSPSDLTRPFATLYELGLVGIIQRTLGTNRTVQYFRPPGRGLSSIEERSLPESELYFVHPTLNHLLPQSRKSKKMIVGQGLSVR
jgi:hypothetical protein